VETRNQADSLVYSTEKLLSEHADKVPDDLKTEVEGKISQLKAAIANNSVAEMQVGINDLNALVQRLGETVYAQTGQPSASTDDPSASGDQPGDSTVEGEFREV
jgi:molecular chaperone DnaK